MSEFVNITTPGGYLFVHYTKIKLVKKDGMIHGYFGDGVMLGMEQDEAIELMSKLDKLPVHNDKKEGAK